MKKMRDSILKRFVPSDVLANNTCWWKANWEAGNYDIPRHFGPWNCVVGQYIFGCTWLDRFRKIDAEMKGGSE
jgi:hypothetical protein